MRGGYGCGESNTNTNTHTHFIFFFVATLFTVNKRVALAVFVAIVIALAIALPVTLTHRNGSGSNSSSSSTTTATTKTRPQLVIYAYDSFMGLTNAVGDTYSYVNAFALYAGIPASSILVVSVKSADLGSTAASFNTSSLTYPADIVMGMDSSQQIADGVFESYNFTVTATDGSSIITPQINQLQNKAFLKPFDYGTVAIIYDPARLTGMATTYANTQDFNLNNLLYR